MTNPLKVQEKFADLCRWQYLETASSRLLGGWLAGIETWELKHEVCRHLWEDAQHSRLLRTRLWELRISNPDRSLSKFWKASFFKLGNAQAQHELLAGLYLVFKKSLIESYEAFIRTAHPVWEAPTVSVLSEILKAKREQVIWAEKFFAQLPENGAAAREVKSWMQFAHDVISDLAAGAENGEDRGSAVAPPGYSMSPLPFPEAKRDQRFATRLDGGSAPLTSDHADQTVWQFYNYAQEMQAAETLGSILWEVNDAPWEFYYDVARHCYDEARHCKMGEVRLNQLGYSLSDFPQMVGNYAWRQLVDPLRRFAILTYVIEAGSFDYKHKTYEAHVAAGDVESAQAVLYDIIDETMHVRFGKKWLPELMKLFGHPESLEALVEECREITRKNTLAAEQRRSLEAA